MNKPVTAPSVDAPEYDAEASTPSIAFKTGLVLAILGSATFSGKAIIVKLGYQYGSDAITLLMLRMSFAVPVLMVMMAIERIGPSMASQIGMVGPIFTISMGVLWL
ncbi:MAG: hypothetical protein ACRC5A_07180 [Enterobacteriaceae bacterium]